MNRIVKKNDTKNNFTIRELAREFDITSRTLRFYESIGLVSPKRKGQSRIYNRRDRARLKLVLQGKRVGFALAEIKEMLDLYDLRDGQKTQLNFSLDKFQQRIQALQTQKTDIEQAITDLERTCDIVRGLLENSDSKQDRTHKRQGKI